MQISVFPVSMISKDKKQRVLIYYKTREVIHPTLTVYDGDKAITPPCQLHFQSGGGECDLFLPVPEKDFEATAVFELGEAKIYKTQFEWKKPREWKFNIMVSSHTDIGLHNPVYVQRYNSAVFTSDAMRLADETEEREEKNRYRYTMEGTWFFNNFSRERGKAEAEKLVSDYIKTNKIGVCSALAGNHTQTYGLEEMCRSAYEKKHLEEEWGIVSRTMSMIDNNGMSSSLIQPYFEAGYENIIFAPNQWNPFKSTIWKMDARVCNANCPEACGGGSRIDVRYRSENPMVFFWKGVGDTKLLVWCSPQYSHGGEPFSIFPNSLYGNYSVENTEKRFEELLPEIERKYGWDMWLFACYGDDQKPCLDLANFIEKWNERWEYPRLQMLGNPDIFFDEFREKYTDKVPVLTGEIAGGWYQHPLSVPELMSKKFEADRLLPTAEKWSLIASLADENYAYPKEAFDRAWYSLMSNDEHSYGTSGYQGRRVFETWIQHRDWIEKAEKTAREECDRALSLLSSKVKSDTEKTLVFNPTLLKRRELVETENAVSLCDIPPMGYRALDGEEFSLLDKSFYTTSIPPVVENDYYKVAFCENGAIASIFDKELEREILDKNDEFGANGLVVTTDNHKNFNTLKNVSFKVSATPYYTEVEACGFEESLACECIFVYRILNFEKRIDVDNRLLHVRGMFNNCRFYRYIYFAYPFSFANSRRLCHTNGAVLDYGDVTGHSTDVYMPVSEWCACEGEGAGAALFMLDSHLVEFDKIHPDKTDFGNLGSGSKVYAYVANDWLQMHTSGGEHINYRFRYSVVSYKGTYLDSGVERIAERISNPVKCVNISAQDGVFTDSEKSFITSEFESRLLTLKPAEDNKGIIARFLTRQEPPKLENAFGLSFDACRNTVDERDFCGIPSHDGFVTLRLGKDAVSVREREILQPKPLSVGSTYTGLVTSPRGLRGENDGQIYLLWGINREENFSHYNVYRSLEKDFEITDETFIARVEPEEFCVGRYVDNGLEKNTCYYYRVAAVSKDGVLGEASEECAVFTKE